MTIDNPNTMKVLITGGGGVLGARLARTILLDLSCELRLVAKNLSQRTTEVNLR